MWAAAGVKPAVVKALFRLGAQKLEVNIDTDYKFYNAPEAKRLAR
jgi:hypothetical protein